MLDEEARIKGGLGDAGVGQVLAGALKCFPKRRRLTSTPDPSPQRGLGARQFHLSLAGRGQGWR
jgi:hypothetical protein